MDISEVAYHQKETGKRDFTMREGIKLAKLYNCSLDELFMYN